MSRVLDEFALSIAHPIAAAAGVTCDVFSAHAATCLLVMPDGSTEARTAGLDPELADALQAVAPDLPIILGDAPDAVRVHHLAEGPGPGTALCAQVGAGSMLGVRMRSFFGEPLGWLVALFDRPRTLPMNGIHLMRSISIVAAAGVAAAFAQESEIARTASLLSEAQRLEGIGWFEIVPDQNRITLSKDLRAAFGLPEGVEATSDALVSRVHPADRASVGEALGDAMSHGLGYHIRFRVLDEGADDGVRWIESRGTVSERAPDGRARRIVGSAREVERGPEHELGTLHPTHERGEQSSLRRVATAIAEGSEPEAIFALVAREAVDILSLDSAGVWDFRGDRAVNVGSYGPRANRLGTTFPLSGDGALARVARAGRPTRVRYRNLPEGDPARSRLLELGLHSGVAAPVVVDGTTWGALLAATSDAADLPPAAEERLERLARLVGLSVSNAASKERLQSRATTDSLTGLVNHGTFQSTLVQATKDATGDIALLLMDIDHFKTVNDEHGHQIGDRVIVELARVLATSARAGDVVGRIGGEEFAWLLPGCDADEAYTAADRLRRAIAQTRVGLGIRITVSLGISTGHGGSPSADVMLEQADTALYASKRRGRNTCTLYRPELEPISLGGAS